MIWENIISFTDKNVAYRFRLSTSRSVNSDQCNVAVDELDEYDARVDKFDFVYDVKQNLPSADFNLHDKPMQVLIA